MRYIRTFLVPLKVQRWLRKKQAKRDKLYVLYQVYHATLRHYKGADMPKNIQMEAPKKVNYEKNSP